MGVSLMLVRYPDETIRFGTYQDTSDVPYVKLAETPTLARGLRGDGLEPEHTEPEVAVEIWCSYGGGFSWAGKARGMYLTDTGYDVMDGFVRGYVNGIPAWVPEDFR